MIERVCQDFLPFEHLAFFGICIRTKGVPISHFHQPTWFGGSPSLTCPSLTFHQPKFYRGVPISHFSVIVHKIRDGLKKLGLIKSERWASLWKTWVEEKWEMGTPLKNYIIHYLFRILVDPIKIFAYIQWKLSTLSKKANSCHLKLDSFLEVSHYFKNAKFYSLIKKTHFANRASPGRLLKVLKWSLDKWGQLLWILVNPIKIFEFI